MRKQVLLILIILIQETTLAAASDDQFGLHIKTAELYSKWIAAKRPAELHIYAKGGHGFGMRKQNLPTIRGLIGLLTG